MTLTSVNNRQPGTRRKFVGRGQFFDCFAGERMWFEHVLSVGSMISNRLKCGKQSSHGGRGGGLGKHCKAALKPFVGIQDMGKYRIYIFAFCCV